MPIYEYKCSHCGKQRDVFQVSNKPDKEKTCSDCGGKTQLLPPSPSHVTLATAFDSWNNEHRLNGA